MTQHDRVLEYLNDGKKLTCLFSILGETFFDDYWMNYGKITITDEKGGTKKITNLRDFIKYRSSDISLIVSANNTAPKKKEAT